MRFWASMVEIEVIAAASDQATSGKTVGDPSR